MWEPEKQAWRELAACRHKNPTIWFPWPVGHEIAKQPNDARRSATAAIQICNGCPVKDACLDYAIDEGLRDGVWGGLIPADRRRVEKARQKQPVSA